MTPRGGHRATGKRRGARPRYVITLEAGDAPVPADCRLRQLLKIAGRGFSFRCIDCRQVESPSDEPRGFGRVGGKGGVT
jgi:hypothetical protein